MLDLVKLYPFNNVAANSTANVDLSNLLGYTIETIYLVLGGTFTKAQMTSIQMKANGKIIVDTSGSATDVRMQHRSLTASTTLLAIDFSEVRGRTSLDLQSGLLDTTFGAGVKNLRLEVAIGGATSPTLSGYAAVSPPILDASLQAVRPLIARVHRSSQTIGAAGEFPLAVPHFDPTVGGSIFKRIHVQSANMTGLRVLRNGIVEHESIAAVNSYRQQYEGLRTPQAGWYVFDAIIDNFQAARVLDTRKAAGIDTAQILGTFSAGETILIEAEVLEPLDVY